MNVQRLSESLIPRPLSVHDHDGGFSFSGKTTIIHAAVFTRQAVFLAEELVGIGCVRTVREDDPERMRGTDSPCILLTHEEDFPAEGYRLEITPTGIHIGATEEKGLFWGIQSLMQLFLYRNNNLGDTIIIPCGTATDSPAFPWRGFMLDCCRHFFSVEFIKKLIAAASRFKLTVFHWHLTDDQGWRIPIPEYPALTGIGSRRTELAYQDGRTYGGFYTHDEIREVVAFAARHNIDVLPEIEAPGHASAILAAYPRFGCDGAGPFAVEDRWGIFENVLNVGKDEVFTMLDAVIRTVSGLFPFPYIHIGGDECPRTQWKTDPLCQKRIRRQGLKSVDELQSWSTVQVNEIASRYGRRIIGWDEILEGTGTLSLPTNAVVMSWRGPEGGIRAAQAGHNVIMCPTTRGCYLDHQNYASPEEPGNLGVATVQESYAFSAVPAGMAEQQKKLVLGGQGNLWTEKIPFSRNAEYMLFPRLCALAEALWLGDEKDFTGFASRMDALYNLLDALDIRYYQGPWV